MDLIMISSFYSVYHRRRDSEGAGASSCRGPRLGSVPQKFGKERLLPGPSGGIQGTEAPASSRNCGLPSDSIICRNQVPLLTPASCWSVIIKYEIWQLTSPSVVAFLCWWLDNGGWSSLFLKFKSASVTLLRFLRINLKGFHILYGVCDFSALDIL